LFALIGMALSTELDGIHDHPGHQTQDYHVQPQLGRNDHPDVAPFAVEVQRWSQLIQAAA
jgi:hypothetical protein